MKVVDLSVDFDFFCREELMWDWGHSEEAELSFMYANTLWQHRYNQLDMYAETDPRVHADFPPESLLARLMKEKGIRLHKAAIPRVAVADSHQHAYAFFKDTPHPPDVLVSIDAHHDVFSEPLEDLHRTDAVNCGNWLSWLYDIWPVDVEYLHVAPKWAEDESLIEGKKRDVPSVRYEHWTPTTPMILRNVFICRSPVWSPPHLDPSFQEMAETFLAFALDATFPGPSIRLRLYPTPEQAAKQRSEWIELVTSRKKVTA